MPEMDGLETLTAIGKDHPDLPVIMFSSLTERGAAITLEALSLGATDYVTKPVNQGSKEAALQDIRNQLISKIKAICQKEVSKSSLLTKTILQPPKLLKVPEKIFQKVNIVAIGASTGGSNALTTLLSAFPANFPVPIVIVQHMPSVFTTRLAERLNQNCQVSVFEGVSGVSIAPGQVWIAPGDFHMVLEREGTEVKIFTNQDQPENFCRPAQDGLHGCECIREARCSNLQT